MCVDLFQLHPDVPIPVYGTTESACFDLTCFPTAPTIKVYDEHNKECDRTVYSGGEVDIWAGDRVLVPTGLILKINVDKLPSYERRKFSIRLHPRSGLSLKKGLILANSEGIVDVDYQQEIFVLMHNISKEHQTIKRGERICQAEVVSNHLVYFNIVKDIPTPHSERSGGFGSTTK